MPPSGRKGKTRVRRAPAATETHEPSDVETADAIATPSRGSRKRARGADATAATSRNTRRKIKDTRALDREDTEGTEPHEPSDNETEPSVPTEQEIIQCLKVSDKQVNATEDFANDLLEGQENVPGYGKIAGRDWVFIIRKVEVNIGRPEAHERLPVSDDGARGTPTAKTVVDIDLGPDRQVSRLHAVIHYDGEQGRWIIIVNGRNGIRVDNNLLKRGSQSYLRNGSVIEIANTQMAFITTPTAENESPIWDASIIRQAQKSSEEDDDGEDDARNAGPRSHAPSGRSHLQDSGMYQSDYIGQQQQQHPSQQRTHPHSQRALQATPGTPMRGAHSFAKSSPAANYARGVMMESTETIDYSADNAKDLKPPHSYAQLIGMAILSTQEQQMTLNNIYKWIMANYAFYRFNTGGWQNSIRHNLSLNKAFTKIARRTDEPGKGMKWMIEPTEFDNFVQQGMKGCRRPNPIPGTQSTLGSPNSPMDRTRAGGKREDDTTPPLNPYPPAYPSAMEAYTPDRGPRRPGNGNLGSIVGLGIEGNNLVDYDYPQRSTPRNGLNAVANAAGSPPALYVNDDGRVGPLDTPFPLRPSQRLAPPSTLRRPSDFIQLSSPAPFWKMDGVNSTPFRPFDLSPLKTPFPNLKKASAEEQKKSEAEESSPVEKPDGEEKRASEEPKSKGSPVVPSSSPPRAIGTGPALDASPTLSRPATAVAKTLSQLANAGKEQSHHAPGKTPPNGNSLAPLVQQHTPPTSISSAPTQPAVRQYELPQTAVANSFESAESQRAVSNGYSNPYAGTNGSHSNGYVMDDGEEDGIDLAKGFQPIGVFHQRNHLAMGMAGAPRFGR
ncbi:hypothetical protein AC579_7506 [Pseudocercospora musae]|uniref:Fork-head domain-containing protein n=1 Tax=Pseudocercospora musae TaxID=113226 RepID=A0A139IC15_9PEZI|nr:hypothetical protein AC579_7506 [Pseudocercospora musae]